MSALWQPIRAGKVLLNSAQSLLAQAINWRENITTTSRLREVIKNTSKKTAAKDDPCIHVEL